MICAILRRNLKQRTAVGRQNALVKEQVGKEKQDSLQRRYILQNSSAWAAENAYPQIRFNRFYFTVVVAIRYTAAPIETSLRSSFKIFFNSASM